MKLKLMLAVVALAGFASALALAGPTQAGDGHHATTGTTTTDTTTTGKHHEGDEHGHRGSSSCQNVELKGSASGSLALAVTQAQDNGSSFVGKQVTLTIPPGATVSAKACVDPAGVLTLRGLEVRVPHAPPTTTGTTTTSHEHESHK